VRTVRPKGLEPSEDCLTSERSRSGLAAASRMSESLLDGGRHLRLVTGDLFELGGRSDRGVAHADLDPVGDQLDRRTYCRHVGGRLVGQRGSGLACRIRGVLEDLLEDGARAAVELRRSFLGRPSVTAAAARSTMPTSSRSPPWTRR